MIDLKQGDCLEIMKNIPDKSVDMILCDLPYGTTKCKWDTIIPFEKLWQQYNRIIKDNGVIVLFASQPFTTVLINSNIKNYKYHWYWIKNKQTGFAFCNYQPMRKVEDICVFYKKFGTYNPQGLKEIKNAKPRKRKNNNKDYLYAILTSTKEYSQKYTGYPNNVLYFNKESKSLHPTQKPVDLLEYLIKTYSNEGYLILDNCMGSGSTGVACVNTNRKFIGIELDEEYFKIAKKRIEEVSND